MNSSIDANDLILYVCIVKHGSFSGAAEELNKTKSTLSRRISLLEKELGGKILKRGVTGVVVTEFGREILEIAKIVYDKSLEVLRYAKSRQETLQGTLKISVPHDFVELVPKCFFSRFSSLYPDIELELDLSNSHLGLNTGQFDLLIRMNTMGFPSDENLIMHRIGDFPRGLYAHPSLFSIPINHPDELVDYTGLLPISLEGKIIPWELYKNNEHWSGIPKKNIKGNSIGSMRSLASLGCGVMVLTHILAHPMVEQGLLTPILPDWHAEPVTMFAISTCRQNMLSAKARGFIEELRSTFETS